MQGAPSAPRASWTPMRVELRDARDARAELEVRAGAVDDARAVARDARAPRRRSSCTPCARTARGPGDAPTGAARRRRRRPARRAPLRARRGAPPRACARSPRAARRARPRRARGPRCTRGRSAAPTRSRCARRPRRASRAPGARSRRGSRVSTRAAPRARRRPGPSSPCRRCARMPDAHARVHDRVVRAHRAHVEDGRRAAEHRLGQPELGARAKRRLVVRRLEGPDAPFAATRGAAGRRPCPRMSTWQRWTCACTSPGMTAQPARVEDARQAAQALPGAPTPGRCPRRGPARRPGPRGPRASHVTTVPPRMSVSTAAHPYHAARSPEVDRCYARPRARPPTHGHPHPRRRRQPDHPQGREHRARAPRLRGGAGGRRAGRPRPAHPDRASRERGGRTTRERSTSCWSTS